MSFKAVKIFSKQVDIEITVGELLGDNQQVIFNIDDFGGTSIPEKLRINNFAVSALAYTKDNNLGTVNFRQAGIFIEVNSVAPMIHAVNVNQSPVINLNEPYLRVILPSINPSYVFPHLIIEEGIDKFNLLVTVSLYVEF